MNLPLSIIYENDEYIVIYKPPSIPIHPSGAFRYNSVLYILAKEQNKTPLFIIHRLDRLTSGLVMLAKTSTVAHEICNLIENDKVIKTYLAKVENKFPETEEEYKHSSFYDESKNKYIKWEDNIIIVSIPTDIVSHHEGTYQTTETGKITITKFTFVKKNDEENTSIVKCIPVTGRTHQIRLHLKYLGFPITNDPLYNPKYNLTFSRDVKPFSDYEVDDSVIKETIDTENIDWNKICPFCIIQNRGEDENIAGFCDSQLDYNEIYLHALQYEVFICYFIYCRVNHGNILFQILHGFDSFRFLIFIVLL